MNKTERTTIILLLISINVVLWVIAIGVSVIFSEFRDFTNEYQKQESVMLNYSELLEIKDNTFVVKETIPETQPVKTQIMEETVIVETETITPQVEEIQTVAETLIVEPETIKPKVEEIQMTSESIITITDDTINNYIYEVCKLYPSVKPELVMSIIYKESRYNPLASNGQCVGLMQVSTYWHSGRATKLGVTDFYDPYSNIILGVDYLSEMLDKYEDPALVLMLYNMKHDSAFAMYNSGKISEYAQTVLAKAEEYR